MPSMLEALKKAGLTEPNAPEEPKRETWRLLMPDDPRSRYLVWEDGVFALEIPRDTPVLAGKYVGHEYLELRGLCSVKGGYIKRYVHPAEGASVRDLLGATSLFKVQLWEKTYVNEAGAERPFFYIDYVALGDQVVSDTIRVLRVMAERNVPEKPRGMRAAIVAFPTPAPLQGVVVIGEPE